MYVPLEPPHAYIFLSIQGEREEGRHAMKKQRSKQAITTNQMWKPN